VAQSRSYSVQIPTWKRHCRAPQRPQRAHRTEVPRREKREEAAPCAKSSYSREEGWCIERVIGGRGWPTEHSDGFLHLAVPGNNWWQVTMVRMLGYGETGCIIM
jgi:hypothetical protein